MTPVVRLNAVVRIASRFNARLMVNVFRGMNHRCRISPAWDARNFFALSSPFWFFFFRVLSSSRQQTRETNLAAATTTTASEKKQLRRIFGRARVGMSPRSFA